MVKLKSMCDSYLTSHSWLAESTKNTTERAFRYLTESIGDMEADRFCYEHANMFKNWLNSSGRAKASSNMYIRAIKPVFNWAVKIKALEGNPFIGLKLFKAPVGPVRVYEQWEFDKMFKICPGKLWQARLLTAKTAGLRRSEVLNLTTADVDFEKMFIYVRPKKETKTTWRWVPKDKEVRKVPLTLPLSRLFMELSITNFPYLLITQQRYKLNTELKDAGLLKDRIRRTPDENFHKQFKRFMKKTDIKGTFHDLRRTYITEMLESGMAPHQVRQLSGHSTLEVMDTYYCATRESMYEQARKLVESIKIGPLIQIQRPRTTSAGVLVQSG